MSNILKNIFSEVKSILVIDKIENDDKTVIDKTVIDKIENDDKTVIDKIENDDNNKNYIDGEILNKFKNNSLNESFKSTIKKISYIHSLIHTDPINYKEFPLSNKCKFLYIELCKNEYLFIPEGWYHWIESEPNTIAFSYSIRLQNNTPDAPLVNDNKLQNCINKNIPFYNKHKEDKFNINYDDFINNSENINYSGEIRDNKYLNIDLKPYIEPSTFFDTINIKNFFQDKKNLNIHSYVGRRLLINTNFEYMKEIPNFNNILNDCITIDTNYDSAIWFNNNKNVNSGLHFDGIDNILYVICGKKKVLLTSPQYKKYLYHINTKRT